MSENFHYVNLMPVPEFVSQTELAALRADRKRLREYEEQHRRILAGECANDEAHCTCVPALRMEVAMLRELMAMKDAELDRLTVEVFELTKRLEG